MSQLDQGLHFKLERKTDVIDEEEEEDKVHVEDKWLRVVHSIDLKKIKAFINVFKNRSYAKDLLQLGLIKAADIGSNYLIDFFIGHEKVDVNCLCTYKGISVSPLIQAIISNRNEAVKYLIFRKADIHQKGEYGDALVTSVHFESSNNIINLVLEKGASLASRHKDWPSLNLREYCVQLGKVQPKAVIDNFVFKLIANGEYEKLKSLTENGYLTINVKNIFGKTGKDLAHERNHYNIINLINKIESQQKRLKTKMNY